jgi:hypothetical protein
MSIQIQGNGGVVADVDGTNFRSLRTTVRPTDHGTLGHYRWGGFTGILPAALAANSEIFQFRWVDATRICLITEINIAAAVSTTFFAAGVPMQLDLIKSTGWTAQGTGGTAVTLGANNKKRTSMGSSLVASGDMRIASTAALGAGTKTLEGNSLSTLVAGCPITASLSPIIFGKTTLTDSDMASGEHPLILATNEGVSIRSVAVPATGTWTLSVTLKWMELTAF